MLISSPDMTMMVHQWWSISDGHQFFTKSLDGHHIFKSDGMGWWTIKFLTISPSPSIYKNPSKSTLLSKNRGFFLEWWWWRYYQKFDGPSLHPIKLKNVMAIKAFCEKLMAITDGPSLMDHHRHVWPLLVSERPIIIRHLGMGWVGTR